MGHASQLPLTTSLTLKAPHTPCARVYAEEGGVPLFTKYMFPNKARALHVYVVVDVSDVKYI